MMTGQSGPSTALKCSTRGMMAADRRVSIMTADLRLVLAFAVTPGWFPPFNKADEEESVCVRSCTRFDSEEFASSRECAPW